MSQLLKEIYSHLKATEKNLRVIELLSAAMIINSEEERVSFLQKDFLIIEVAHSYKHFGFSLFSKTSLNFITRELSNLSNVSQNFIKKWLIIVADLILEELTPTEKETLFDQNTDILEYIFSSEFIKRIFCTEKEEDYLTGMSIFPEEFIEKIRNITRNKISKMTSHANQTYNDNVLNEEEFFLDEYQYLKMSVFNYLNNLQEDPLSLLSWRLESFIHFNLTENSKKIFNLKYEELNKKNDSKKVMSIISLLVPHIDSQGNLLLPNSPISIPQIAKIFSSEFKSENFQVEIIRNWLSPYSPENIKKELEIILNTGVDCGLFFKIPNGNKSLYGLSENGLKVIKPFHKVLTDTILIQHIDQI